MGIGAPDLGGLSLVAAAAAVRERQVSPVELTEHYLGCIEETEPRVHAWFTVDAEGARRTARRAEAAVLSGEALGALHGVPVGVKDLIDTAGLRTTYGSPLYERHLPTRDATVVRRLRSAGVVLLGKQATHELAWGGRTDSAYFGPTRNPHDRDRIAGGSSGGSAASVAVGSCLGAIGTDTAGSVRIPAALSGCVGYKPSRGRVSLAGVMPLAPSLDHVGSLARTVEDAAALVDAVAGPDAADPGTRPWETTPERPDVRELSAGVLGGWFTALLHPGVAGALDGVRDALRSAGLSTYEHDVPDQPDQPRALLTQVLAEAGARHRADFQASPSSFGADLATLLAMPAPTPRELAAGAAATAALSHELWTALASYDVLVAPTVAVPAPRLGQDVVQVTAGSPDLPIEEVLTRLTSPFNALGVPVVSVPAGVVGGLPVGVQVIGRPGDDRTALAVAAVIEDGTP